MDYDNLEFIITKIISVIGIIPCILYIILVILKKKMIPLVIIGINIAINSIIFEVCYFFPKIDEVDFYCKLQIFLTCYSQISILLWTTIYSIIAFLLILYQKFFEKNSFLVYIISYIVGYLFTLIYPIYVIYKESYSKDPNYFYCWLKSEEQKIFVLIIIIIFIINIIFIITILIYIKYQLNKIIEEIGTTKNQFKKYFFKFFILLIAQILVYFQLLYDNKEALGMTFLSERPIIVIITHIFASSEGMIITLTYCYSYETFTEIKLLLCCKLERERNSLNSNGLNDNIEEIDMI